MKYSSHLEALNANKFENPMIYSLILREYKAFKTLNWELGWNLFVFIYFGDYLGLVIRQGFEEFPDQKNTLRASQKRFFKQLWSYDSEFFVFISPLEHSFGVKRKWSSDF